MKILIDNVYPTSAPDCRLIMYDNGYVKMTVPKRLTSNQANLFCYFIANRLERFCDFDLGERLQLISFEHTNTVIWYLTPKGGKYTFDHNEGDNEYNAVEISDEETTYKWIKRRSGPDDIALSRDIRCGPALIYIKSDQSYTAIVFYKKVPYRHPPGLTGANADQLIHLISQELNNGEIGIDDYIKIIATLSRWGFFTKQSR